MDRPTADRQANSLSAVRASGDPGPGRLTHWRSAPHAGRLQPEGCCTPGRFGRCAEMVLVVSVSKCPRGRVGGGPESCYAGASPVQTDNTVQNVSSEVYCKLIRFLLKWGKCINEKSPRDSAYPRSQNTFSRGCLLKPVSHWLFSFLRKMLTRIFSAS